MNVKITRIALFSLGTMIIVIGSYFLSPDKFTWVLEVFPILIGYPILLFTYKRFRLTDLLYLLLLIHFTILAVGGIYTYAKVPLGFWMQDWFGFSRNNYDKIGHFMQGFVPALLIREILLRTSPLRKSKWLSFLTVSVCLAVSAMYELVEWWVSAAQGASADDFLGTQGYQWDAQSDMLFALIGAVTALIFLSRIHDTFIAKVK